MFFVHVEDFVWGRTERLGNVVITQIRSNFQVRELDIVWNEHGITLYQKSCVNP